MTDFRKDAKYLIELMTMGVIEKVEIFTTYDCYVIETEEEVFRYDIITEKQVF